MRLISCLRAEYSLQVPLNLLISIPSLLIFLFLRLIGWVFLLFCPIAIILFLYIIKVKWRFLPGNCSLSNAKAISLIFSKIFKGISLTGSN